MYLIDEQALELNEMLDDDAVLTDFTLADAIRMGSYVTEHSTEGWGQDGSACALHAGVIAARSFGHL